MLDPRPHRRRFLRILAGALTPLAAGASPRALVGAVARWSGPTTPEHPEPRPGIDASRVLAADRVGPEVADLYDAVREIPHVVDGVRCHCGCARVPGMYSLLSCYEESGMARHCDVCQGEGRLVTRLHREGRTLDEIRAAVDRRFG